MPGRGPELAVLRIQIFVVITPGLSNHSVPGQSMVRCLCIAVCLVRPAGAENVAGVGNCGFQADHLGVKTGGFSLVSPLGLGSLPHVDIDCNLY